MACNFANIPPPMLPSNLKLSDWEFFLCQLSSFFVISDVPDKKMFDVALHLLGPDGINIYDGFKEPKNTFDSLCERFKEYFSGGSSVLLHRKRFMQASQQSNESIAQFAGRLRRMAVFCCYDKINSILCRDVFVAGVHNDRIGERLLIEDFNTLTFDAAIAKAETIERAISDRYEVAHKSSEVAQIKSDPHKQPRYKIPTKPPQTVPLKSCRNCGYDQHTGPECSAKKAQCRKCGKLGHFLKFVVVNLYPVLISVVTVSHTSLFV